MTQPLVSVVIPAFNGAATIDETLRSVRGQSWRELEIVVVDDGSTDDTVEVAGRHMRADPRVRVICQPNAGVAAARNAGWRSAASDLIAFVDSDDLWAEDKIARQMAVLAERGEGTGLVYSRYALIDGERRIIYRDTTPVHEGEVLRQLMHGNFVGNGSAALVRRAALESSGGFEPALHQAGAQGCEDILFYLRVAENWRFGVVHQADIGYRLLPDAMSADLSRMFRSWLLVREEMLARHPDYRASLDAGAQAFWQWLFERSIQRRQWRQVPRLLTALGRWRVRSLARLVPAALRELARARNGGEERAAPPEKFAIGEPA